MSRETTQDVPEEEDEHDDKDDPDNRQANRLRILVEASHLFAEASIDVERLLELVARRFADLVGDGCYIRLLASDGMSLEPVATYHPDPETERYLREMTDSISLRVGEGISGRVVETGESVLMPNVPFEQYRKMTKPEFVPIFERVGITSLIVVRLRARTMNLGFLALVRNGVGRASYTQEDLDLVQDLANRASLAIYSARLLKDLERRVFERTKELESANRELEAFSYSVAHDLRGPLRAIDGFSAMLEEDHAGSLDNEARRKINVIRRNAQRMGNLIDDLLRFSHLGRRALSPANVSMQKIVASITEELLQSEPSRTIEIQIAESLPSAYCDPDLIRQVWTNLLSNAVKYTRTRAVARLEISGVVAEERETKGGAGEVCYTVKDNGVGFDPKYSDKLFGVFQRLHNTSEFEGTGVGLALVQRIVARHGGRVWAESPTNEGATFGFALPTKPTVV